MKNILTILLLVLCTLSAEAYVKRMGQDAKWPTQAALEYQNFGAPIAALATRVVSGTAGNVSATAVTLSTFTLQPDVPRNLTITPAGTTGDVEACSVVVNGTNIQDKVISETFAFLADASTATVGSKAFKTVTSVVFPANCESGGFAATWSIGVGEKIGLKRCLAVAGDWAWSTAAGAYETTRATMAASASAVESNTADFNGTMNGSNAFKAYYVQNFQCMPGTNL